MSERARPSISAVVAAYQAERFIGEALESILGQTRPPDEVVVVDDGSTDGTAREIERFADKVRILRRPNGGCPAAFNTAFAAARGDFVAMCGADDIWEPHKLEWQEEAIREHPEADVFFGHAVLVGRIEGEHARPPITGLLDGDAFREVLFRQNCMCAPSVVIRRSLFERLGPFIEDFAADDFEYWFRCLRAGARFYYDPRPLLSWRQHGSNLSAPGAWNDTCISQVLRWYEGDVADRAVVCEGLAPALFRSGRRSIDEGKPEEARQTLREVLRYAHPNTAYISARALAWVVILGMPTSVREPIGRALVGASRTFKGSRRKRRPALS